MARPVRVDVQDGWYHVMARGTERRTLFVEDRYSEHFLDLLAAMSERYAVQVHAYVLMGNHYHLLVRTPEANASRGGTGVSPSQYTLQAVSSCAISGHGKTSIRRFDQRLQSDATLRSDVRKTA